MLTLVLMGRHDDDRLFAGLLADDIPDHLRRVLFELGSIRKS